MNTYYFTFQWKFMDEKHPKGGHPEGWFEIVAPNYGVAVNRMFEECGSLWAGSYQSGELRKELYPKGCLRRLVCPEPTKPSSPGCHSNAGVPVADSTESAVGGVTAGETATKSHEAKPQ